MKIISKPWTCIYHLSNTWSGSNGTCTPWLSFKMQIFRNSVYMTSVYMYINLTYNVYCVYFEILSKFGILRNINCTTVALVQFYSFEMSSAETAVYVSFHHCNLCHLFMQSKITDVKNFKKFFLYLSFI